MGHTSRATVDLAPYPDLVVIYLGMRAQSLSGARVLRRMAHAIAGSVTDRPDGLLHHESFWFGLLPPHAGIRQYWRDFDALESWARGLPHRDWWASFIRDPKGTCFWHETYAIGGGFEAIYGNVTAPIGLSSFAPIVPARGAMFTARRRSGYSGSVPEPVVSEMALYGSP